MSEYTELVSELQKSSPEHTGFCATYHIYQYRIGLKAGDAITALETQVKELREALRHISLGSQNTGTTKEDLGRTARAALAAQAKGNERSE